METLKEFLVPYIGSAKWQIPWNVLNLVAGVMATAMLAQILARLMGWNNGNRGRKQTILLIGIAVSIQGLLAAASGFLRYPDLEFPLYYPLYPFVEFLDEFLNLRNLINDPVSKLPLVNLGVSIFRIYFLALVAKVVFHGAQDLTELFANYLEKQFTQSKVSDFVKKVWGFLKKAGLFGITVTASAEVFTTESYREEIDKVLDWLYGAISKITLLSHLPENAATFPEMAYSFFVVVCSILIAAVYLLLIVMVCAVISVLWTQRKTILDNFKKWFKEIGYILLIVAIVLVVVLISVLFATENASFQQAITLFIQDSPRTIFVLVQHTIMILAALAIAAVMGITLVAAVMFGYSFWCAWRQTIQVQKGDAASARRFLKRFGGIFLTGLAALLFVFGYDPIRGWLVDRFVNVGGHGVWWVAFRICSCMAAFATVVSMGVLCIYLFLYILAMAVRAVRGIVWSAQGGADDQVLPLAQQVKAYFFSLAQTIFRIFKGYQTEDQKNAAIYVAACFASLASLVNTAVGLHDFNIGWFLAIAMSFAVQLAMLIFGMKAGQGIAENIVSDVRQVGANVLLAILRKLASGVCYVLAFFAVQYGISILAGETVLSLSLDLLSQKETFLPALLIWIAALVFFYGVLKQGVDVISLLYRWWKGRKNGKSGNDLEDGLILGNPRRIPARYPLMAYLLFMLVSTTFAFTNLFGGYANQVQLHTRVYDQVYSETEKKLELQDTAAKVVDAFLDNKQTVLKELRKSYDVLVKKDEANKDLLERNKHAEKQAEKKEGSAYGKWERYTKQMADFPSFYEGLVSFINREYDLLGESMNICVRQYSHDEYKMLEIVINSPTFEESVTIGAIKADWDDAYEKHTMERTIEAADKYMLLNELFAVYENYAKEIMECVVTPYDATALTDQDEENEDTTKNDNSIDSQLTAITDGLYNMERLDGVRRNIAELYFASDPDAAQCVSMIDLPRVMDLYLMQEKAVQPEPSVPAQTLASTETTAPTEPSASTETSAPTEPIATTETAAPTEPTESEEPEHSEEKYDKLVEYQNLSDYVDRCIQVYNILNVVEHTQSTAQNGGNGGATVLTQPSVPTDPAEDQEADAVYTVRTYRSYARGVASSNLQISFDALFKGEMGLNGTGTFMDKHDGEQHNINALYSAQMVAVFILIICALVDFMAFFSGLLLFQDIFLLEMKGKSKLSKLGYIAFDAILTKYLMPPERIGDHRKRKIALIYYLLYCEYNKPKDKPLDKKHVDQALLARLKVDPDAFKVLLYRTLEYLESNSVAVDTPEFHGWLDSFVKKNGIEFDEVLT